MKQLLSWTVASLLVGACARTEVPAASPSRESGQSALMGKTVAGAKRCDPKSHDRPFVIEWDATDMSSFEAKAATDVVFVKYEGCNLRVLDGCGPEVHGMLGAYGAAMKTGFNGFGNAEQIVVEDEPMASLYRSDRIDPRASDNVVSLR